MCLLHAGDSPLLLLQQNGFSTVKNHNNLHHFLDSPVDFNKNWGNHRDGGDDQSKKEEEKGGERAKEGGERK